MKESCKINFGERLNELIITNNLEVPILAKDFVIDESTLYRYLANKRMPTLEIFIKIANYFGCSSDYLSGRKETDYKVNFKDCPPFSTSLKKCIGTETIYNILKVTGISKSVFYKWLKGKAIPTIHSLIKVAKALDCTLDELVGRE